MKNYSVYGRRKLTVAARRAGLELGREQVARLMRRQGIRSSPSPTPPRYAAQHARLVDQLAERPPPPRTWLRPLARCWPLPACPRGTGARCGATIQEERLNKELRRRTDLVGIFPDRQAVIRLVGAVLAEQHHEWAVTRRYVAAGGLTKARLRVITGEGQEVSEHEPTEVMKNIRG